jgi:hypothetical protein
MKRLPRRHRIAHLRALTRQQPACAFRREELLSLLRDEISAQPDKEKLHRIERPIHYEGATRRGTDQT